MTDDGKKKGFSFSFGGKQSAKVRSATALRSETLDRTSNERQVVQENPNSNTIFSNKQPIVPLITKNIYLAPTQPPPPLEKENTTQDHINNTNNLQISTSSEPQRKNETATTETTATNATTITTSTPTSTPTLTITTTTAIKADHEISSEENLSDGKKYGLIINTHIHQRKKENNGSSICAMIQSNRVPGLEHISNMDKKTRLDVMQRPDMDDPSLVSNGLIGIEDFGKAALLGMGWKEGQPIGKNYGTIKMKPMTPLQAKPRPRQLGLGAKDNLFTLSDDPKKKKIHDE